MKSLIIMWAVALVLLLIVEGATAQLVTIWFAAGALAALIAAALKAPLWLQITLFVVVSAVTLIATRPIVKKITNRKAESLNADRIIGRQAIVTERIDNLEGTGTIKVDGLTWTARSADDSVYEPGSQVTIDKIEGVKAIVRQ
jgi:membrane protein implicated in regulation of membrane protease activity